MIQALEDLRENRPKELEESVLTSLKLHRRYILLLSISAGKAPQSTTVLMAQVFGDLRGNRPVAMKYNDIKSLQARSRYNSIPHMAFETNSVGDAPEAIPSVASMEMQVLKDSPSTESTNSELMTPAAVGASDIESLLPVSSNLPPVQPVDSSS